MNVDRYTKVTLTVIAAALVWIAAQDAVAPSWAQSTTPVRVTGTVDVQVVGGYLSYETDVTGGRTLKVCTQC